MGVLVRAQHKQNLSLLFIGFFPVAFSSCLLLPPSLHLLPPRQLKWKPPGMLFLFFSSPFPKEITHFHSKSCQYTWTYTDSYFLSTAPSQSPGSFENENVYCLFFSYLIKALQPSHLFLHCSLLFLNEIITFSSLESLNHTWTIRVPLATSGHGQSEGGRRSCLFIVVSIFVAIRGNWFHIVQVIFSTNQGFLTFLA